MASTRGILGNDILSNMLYVWYGPNEYAKEEQILAHIKKTGLVRVDFSASNPPTSVDALLAQDLFSGGQVIVLDGLVTSLLQEKTIPQFAASSNHLIFIEPTLDKRLKTTKDLLAHPQVNSKEFLAPSLEQLPEWLVAQAKARGGVLRRQEAVLLLQRLGLGSELSGLPGASVEVSLGRLIQELDKLLVYSNGETITAEAVQHLVSEEQVVVGLAVSDALVRKDRTRLYHVLNQYYSQTEGGDETTRTLQLVGLLAEQFRSLLLLQDALNQRMSEGEIVALTGWKPGRIFVLKKNINAFRPDMLRGMLSKLESLDLELKTTSTPARVVLELILAQAA